MKTDAQALLTSVAAQAEASIVCAFTLSPASQFDQAGLLVLIDEHTWAKAGIEFVDGSPRLAMVVTNGGYSDWSTSPWPQWDASARTVSAVVRLSKLQPGAEQGGCLVFEAAEYVPGVRLADPSLSWQQVRIASLRGRRDRAWRMGVSCMSPIAQAGCSVRYHSVHLGPKVEPVHEAALPAGHGGL